MGSGVKQGALISAQVAYLGLQRQMGSLACLGEQPGCTMELKDVDLHWGGRQGCGKTLLEGMP